MIAFILFFLLLYGGLHIYAFWRFNSVFHFSASAGIFIALLLIILVCAPILVRVTEKLHWESVARFLAYCGYIWMAFIFLFFCISLSFDAVRLILKFTPLGLARGLLSNVTLALAVFLSFAFVIYGFIDAQSIRVKKLDIYTRQKIQGEGKIRIVQISDVHTGLIIKKERLQLLLDKVIEANPDILISTGDLLDGQLNDVLPLAELFLQVKPRLGKIAITGNHEYFAGLEKSLEFTRRAGFEVLRDEVKEVAGIAVIGVDDITGRHRGAIWENTRVAKLGPAIKDDQFILLLKHQPVVNDNEKFNLQLSGHTHGGQLFPFRLITYMFFPKDYGFYKLDEDKFLYVSRGTGTWGPPVRVFAPAEITVIDIMQKDN